MEKDRPTGILALAIVMSGQVISLLGSGMTGFALSIWIWEKTGQATPFALSAFLFTVPVVLFGPIAGALADRWNRKLIMALSDLGAGLTTLVLLVLYATGNLQIWHIYVNNLFAGAFRTFQFPAFSAAVTMMVPREHYARVSGMISLARSVSGIFAPALAAALLALVGIAGIMAIDLVTFIVAIGALLFVHIPQPAQTEAGREGRGSFLEEAIYGFRYIFARPSLFGLLTLFLTWNFFSSLAFTVFAPMILGRTDNNEWIFGTVQSSGAIGGVLGGLVLSAWGGPKRRIHGVLLSCFLMGLAGAALGLGQSLPIWAVSIFLAAFFGPFANGSSQAIWQAKVAPDVQGRVFATRYLIATLVSPISQLVAGPLADHLLEPAMTEGGPLVSTFGWLVGTGTGTGIALLFLITGLLAALTGLIGYVFPAVRDIEDILPDHEARAAADAGAQTTVEL